MTCTLCDDSIEQTDLLQTILDTKGEDDTHVNWVEAKRAIEGQTGLSLTVTQLKTHTQGHIQITREVE